MSVAQRINTTAPFVVAIPNGRAARYWVNSSEVMNRPIDGL